MQVTPEELATLIGLKDIEIMVLQKEIKALHDRLEAANAPAAKETVSAADTGQEASKQ